ncbi:hypothetical protein LTR84_006264 [Exophiala bonariae]|uniref:Histone deacetylation protein Rxt3 n=1 Tax=Exophiala bonariae TaxID=1690606 RepID=A0AAV9N208_9EURO|nr:hypothetical protein LTR84_006264 [Exophiala bonariae]
MPSGGEYSYKPRSETPDQVAITSPGGVRAHRSNSGTLIQRSGPFYDPPPRSTPNPQSMGRFSEPNYTPSNGPTTMQKEENEDRVRRTSISGLLQRPESQPQLNTGASGFSSNPGPHMRPDSIPPSFAQVDRTIQQSLNGPDIPRSNGLGSYDTRPPPSSTPLSRLTAAAPTPQSYPHSQERPLPRSLSPEIRRSQLNGAETRGLAGLLNQHFEHGQGSQPMMRQDSIQSQSDRSVLGDRPRIPNRAYSPFAGSVISQHNGPFDDLGRKGSDELSQHRALLSLANESKRGRYSPVPQAVQGAQAQTPTPDAAIKTEHGRVFSGLGGGLNTANSGPTSTPQPLPASPFKQNEGTTRLSEENLMKMSRSTSGISKRPRKALNDEQRAESDVGDVKRSGAGKGKRSKYQHSYKLELEDAPAGQRKNATFGSASTTARRGATPTSHPSQLHHHQLQRQASATGNTPVFRPKQTIRIASVIALAGRNRRRHLGSFKYSPTVGPTELTRPTPLKFDVSIRPSLLPSFSEAEHINCTYTIRVSRTWLQEKERGIICAERYLWGSGIYTDDSDPLAAAMHAGFISSVHPAGIDEALLERVIEEQNPKIEGSTAPEKPKKVEEGKDLHITLVVLPPLEHYTDSVRFGIKSRSWPEESWTMSEGPSSGKSPHDGVSFMVLKVDFVEDGIEAKRVGRTGVEKRERLRRELMERKRSGELEKQKIAEAVARAKVRKEEQKRRAAETALKRVKSTNGTTKSDSLSRPSEPSRKEADEQPPQPQKPVEESNMQLDVGQSPGEWIRQLTVAAA